ncbi:MAG: hypothetical protein HRT99_04275 [Mycoplasmatales bacterium]|nr:hypothetical protein [Mycoplasmatales bacterium]
MKKNRKKQHPLKVFLYSISLLFLILSFSFLGVKSTHLPLKNNINEYNNSITINNTNSNRNNLTANNVQNSTSTNSSNELDDNDMKPLYKEVDKVNTTGSLMSLGKITRISLSGFHVVNDKVNINELEFIDSNNSKLEYEIKKINFFNSRDKTISLDTDATDNYKLSDGDFTSNENHSLQISNIKNAKSVSLEIFLKKPSVLKSIKISEKVNDNSNRHFGELALMNEAEKIYVTNNIPDIFDDTNNDINGNSFNLIIHNQSIDWDKFSSSYIEDAPILFIPDFSRINQKFDSNNWVIDWFAEGDGEDENGESEIKAVPKVHGGYQNTYFTLTNIFDSSKTFKTKINNSVNLNIRQAINIFKDITDEGIHRTLIDIFKSELPSLNFSDIELDLNYENFNKLLNKLVLKNNFDLTIFWSSFLCNTGQKGLKSDFSTPVLI